MKDDLPFSMRYLSAIAAMNELNERLAEIGLSGSIEMHRLEKLVLNHGAKTFAEMERDNAPS